MTKTALDEKDKHICMNCYLRSKNFLLCLLTGEEVFAGNTCDKWLADRKGAYNEIN